MDTSQVRDVDRAQGICAKRPRGLMATRGEYETLQDTDKFIKAYHDFKGSVDFTKSGFMPELDNLVWMLLMGIPNVPADDDKSEGAAIAAVDQRINILKAIFVEVNRDQGDEFIDQGLVRYDQAGKMAKIMLKDTKNTIDATTV